jgi:4-amino-4-deoxy-L-arabinose transferase-like glycosyltransferase
MLRSSRQTTKDDRLPHGAAEPQLQKFGISAAIAASLFALSVFIPPLRLGEILQAAAVTGVTHVRLARWIAHVPDAAPLNYFAQYPFLAAFGSNRFGARIVSLLFAIGASYLFLNWAKRIPLRRPYLAALVFLLLPLHYVFATRGQPFEQGLLLVLVATVIFFRLVKTPGVLVAAIYSFLLTLCLYTDPFSFLPAIGLLAGLFAFVSRAHERRALWFVLPATLLPVLLFLPYLIWSHPQTLNYWLFEPPVFPGGTPLYLQPLYTLAAQGWAACGLAFVFVWAMLTAAWTAWRLGPNAPTRRRILVCCCSAVVVTIALALCLDAADGRAFAGNQILWIVPSLIVLAFAAFERMGRLLNSPRPLLIGAGALLLLSAVCDITYLSSSPVDIGREAKLVKAELTGNSCVVFVSERLSKTLFLVFQPELARHECIDFFHSKIVLASHAYVSPDQQRDAESFFRGLNFVPVKRTRAGGGQIVVMEQGR